jgi:protein-S-isoprenylcysteine O-methyltransferase Ste14
VAQAQGWHDQRAAVQTIFVLAIAIGGLATLSVLLKLTRDLLPRHVLAFFGLSVLAVFLLLRASSFHDVEAAMKTEILGMRISWIFELTGIICVGLCAILNYWWHRKLPVEDGPSPLCSASTTSPGAAEADATQVPGSAA